MARISYGSQKSRPGSDRVPRCSLHLERLEDREVPALIPVTTLADLGPGSLRDAITQANASTGVSDDIVFDGTLNGVISLQSALPDLTDSVTIAGPGAPVVALTRSGTAGTDFGFFTVASGVAYITGLTMTGATNTPVINFGTLTLDRVVIQNNTITIPGDNFPFGDPGGIGNTGILTVQNSTIANNVASGGLVAGGIDSEGGSITVVNSTISGNISSNNNSAGGIGIYGGMAFIRNSTITLNQANNTGPNTSGGGIDASGTSVTIVNTVVAGNSSLTTSSDVSGMFTSPGGNYIGVNNAGATGFSGGDRVGTVVAPLNALLGPLTINGGPTPTHQLLPGSPLIDTGLNSGVSAADDQRGYTPRVFNGTVDVGAYEVGATDFVFVNPQPTPFARRASYGNPGVPIQLIDPETGELRQLSDPFPGFTGSVLITLGDVNGDGIADVVAVTGPGGNSHVKVFDGTNEQELLSFMAYAGFQGGVSVATGDVNGDGHEDIITGTGAGLLGGHVKVFDGATSRELLSFMAYAGFDGGISVAAGDINDDGFAEILTGTLTGIPHVRSFAPDGTPKDSFTAPNITGLTGVLVLAVDVDGDDILDIVTVSPDQTYLPGIFGWRGMPVES